MTKSPLSRAGVRPRNQRTMRTSGVALVAGIATFLTVGVAGCESSTGLDPGADARALKAAAQKWEATAPPSYVFTLEKLCFCPTATPLRVTVNNGVVERAQVVATGAFLTNPELEWVPTIPDVFAALAYALDLPAAAYTARFDPEWGFPTEASIDHWAQAVDDEVSYKLSDFSSDLPSALASHRDLLRLDLRLGVEQRLPVAEVLFHLKPRYTLLHPRRRRLAL